MTDVGVVMALLCCGMTDVEVVMALLCCGMTDVEVVMALLCGGIISERNGSYLMMRKLFRS